MTEEEAKTFAHDGRAEYRVWWIPQVPMKSFLVTVTNYAEGLRLCEVLADYDRFQFDNKIKPDYCNVGGVNWKHPELTEGEWWDLDENEADDLGLAGQP